MIDPEKEPTTSVDRVLVHHPFNPAIIIESRYQKQDELVDMFNALMQMPDVLREHVREVWCDSKASCWYRIKADTRDRGVMIEIANAFSAGLKGWNAITVETDGDTQFGEFHQLDPYWPEDEEQWQNETK